MHSKARSAVFRERKKRFSDYLKWSALELSGETYHMPN